MSDAPSGGGDRGGAGPALHSFIRQGRSFSGRERNCCFLNLGDRDERFADVSAVSGFDFPDDGRAVARVDWDRDGDLDFWVVNRSGPQIRFLRNDLVSGNHHVAIRLVGRDCNRDAIGARVELVPAGSPDRKLIKTVRAGDGFLAQSSLWLHFGLGSVTEVERLDVRWPGGEVESFHGIEVDGRYRVEQGSGQPERLRVSMPPPLQASELSSPVTQDPARVPCAARLPVPLLGYQTFDGRYLPVIRPGARAPTLVILWASWCAPCMVELREIAQSAEALRAAGLEVVALSVDALGEKPGSTAAELSALLERLAFPFAAGLATEGTVQKLQLVYERLFDLHRPFPVPVSFLIGPEGDLAFVYRGPVDLRQLTTDVATTRAGHGPRDSGVVPFAGRWLRAPGRMSPYSLAWDLFENGFAAEGVRYVDDHRRLLESHVGFPALLVMAGNARMATGEAAAALALYREALALDTQYADAQNNLAWLLATHPDSTLRDGAEAVELAEAASRAMGASNPSVWDTLSAAYAEAGEFEKAVTAAEKGLSLARHDGNSRLADAIARRLDLYRSGRPFRAE